MVDISNKTLAVLLLAAMVVSLGGTIVSLNKLGSGALTGYATSSSNGTVNLTVGQSLSITTADSNSVQFGSCTPASGSAVWVASDNTYNGSSNPCTGGNLPKNISVRNDGNIYCNVTINFSKVGRANNNTAGTFLNSSTATSKIEYKGGNIGVGYTGGCSGITTTYTSPVQPLTEYLICPNLTAGVNANSFVVGFNITIPYDVPQGADTITLVFQAR